MYINVHTCCSTYYCGSFYFRYSAQTVAVYFGISMVTMSPAEGSAHPYQSGCISNPGSHELTAAAKSRYTPTKTAKCEQILLPALPRADLQAQYVGVMCNTLIYTVAGSFIVAPCKNRNQ